MERDLHFSILVDSAPLLRRFMAKRRYSKKASSTVESAMRRRTRGTLQTGSGAKVKSRKQAIAIGLSEARAKGAKVPRKRVGRKTSRKAGTRKR